MEQIKMFTILLLTVACAVQVVSISAYVYDGFHFIFDFFVACSCSCSFCSFVNFEGLKIKGYVLDLTQMIISRGRSKSLMHFRNQSLTSLQLKLGLEICNSEIQPKCE